MADILVEKPSKEKLAKMGVSSWPIWEKEKSKFDWHYDDKETCYILEGKVTVTGKDGQRVNFAAGDLVVFPSGLSCVWEIHEPVRKHYNFG
ncbi:MAG: cupin domain-containing protein [Candidatus Omnitrophota bacterium]